jgi:hypothetical protein
MPAERRLGAYMQLAIEPSSPKFDGVLVVDYAPDFRISPVELQSARIMRSILAQMEGNRYVNRRPPDIYVMFLSSG